MMYSKNTADVRAWIRDGVTASKSQSETWKKERDQGALVMPAFGDRLSKRELEDVVAFVRVMGGELVPEDSLAHHGLERASALGCVGCHGLGGRFARPNPGSLKGYIPSWDGSDFPELVRDKVEFELPLNQVVEIGFTLSHPGTIRYACAMDMIFRHPHRPVTDAIERSQKVRVGDEMG